MTPDKDPWNRRGAGDGDGDGGRPARHHGPWLWAALVAGVAGLIWLLLAVFPQRNLDSTDWVQIVKLVTILAVCTSGLLFVRRLNLGETLRNMAIWAAIGGVLLIGYSFRHELAWLRDRLAGELMPSQAVELGNGVVELRAGAGGHFTVTAEVNGMPVDFLIDTGASAIVLSPADAARLGYRPRDLNFTQQYSTANGIGLGAPVRLDSLAVGSIRFDNLPASVNEAPMGESLLGMTFLSRLTSYEVRGDRMILRR